MRFSIIDLRCDGRVGHRRHYDSDVLRSNVATRQMVETLREVTSQLISRGSEAVVYLTLRRRTIKLTWHQSESGSALVMLHVDGCPVATGFLLSGQGAEADAHEVAGIFTLANTWRAIAGVPTDEGVLAIKERPAIFLMSWSGDSYERSAMVRNLVACLATTYFERLDQQAQGEDRRLGLGASVN